MGYIRDDSFSFTHSRGLKLINKKKGDVGMNYNDPKTTEMYVDFLWQTVNYWRNIAATNKEELDYYRDLVKALVKGEMDLETLKELEGDDE